MQHLSFAATLNITDTQIELLRIDNPLNVMCLSVCVCVLVSLGTVDLSVSILRTPCCFPPFISSFSLIYSHLPSLSIHIYLLS